MKRINLKAEPREITGRNTKRLRKQGILPGNIYSKKAKSQNVQVSFADFRPVFEQAGETGLVDLSVGEEIKNVLISNVQVDPVYDKPLHVDFREVDLKEKVKATVPVELTGESPAEKSGIGTPVQQLTEVEVEALPTELPESFAVDISALSEVDQAIYVKDLKYDKSKIEILEDIEQIIVKIEPPQEEEVEAAPVETIIGDADATAEGEEAPAGEDKEKEEAAQEKK